MFVNRAADALRDTAVDVALGQHRVDHDAAIVNHAHPQQLELAVGRIDFDDRADRRIGPRRIRRGTALGIAFLVDVGMAEVARRLESRFDLLGVNSEGVVVDRAHDLVELDVTRGCILGKDFAAVAFQVRPASLVNQ